MARKAQGLAGTEQDDLSIECCQPVEIFDGQRLEAGGGPVWVQLIGENRQIAGMTDTIDADITVAIGGDGVQMIVVLLLKLHRNCGTGNVKVRL